jgi:signal transduction histidine kinase
MEQHPDSQTGQQQGQLNEKELRKLLDVGRMLVAELDVEAVLRLVLETARELTGARYAALGILDERKEELERFVFVGIDEETRRLIGPLPRGGGVLGELIRNPEPLRLPDVTQHRRSYGFPPGHPPMTTFLGVPISIRGEAWGNLYLTDKAEGEEFDERDQESAIVLAEWAAIAIGNARLYEDVARRRGELERAVRGLEATATVARAVGFETDLDRVLELVVKRGRALLDADSLLVILEEGDELRVVAAAGEIPASTVGAAVPLEGSLPGAVLASGTSERVARLADRVGHGLDAVAANGAAALVAPLGFRDRARGVLVALGRGRGARGFEPDEDHLLTSFGASAAIAIATAQSVEANRLKHSIRASESERSRWARELHDETLQELGALKVMLESAHRSGRSEAIQDAVERSLEQLGSSISALQGLITELRPASLDELGLKPALEALVRRTSARFDLDVDASFDLAYDSGREPSRLLGEIESTAYRLVQEAINNAVKHAQTESLKVEVVEADGNVRVTVSDHGKGFDTGTAGGGFGLVGMHERVELVGGRLTIDSTPNEGTAVRAELPATHEPIESSGGGLAARHAAEG